LHRGRLETRGSFLYLGRYRTGVGKLCFQHPSPCYFCPRQACYYFSQVVIVLCLIYTF
jgi:hypothetical protein